MEDKYLLRKPFFFIYNISNMKNIYILLKSVNKNFLLHLLDVFLDF